MSQWREGQSRQVCRLEEEGEGDHLPFLEGAGEVGDLPYQGEVVAAVVHPSLEVVVVVEGDQPHLEVAEVAEDLRWQVGLRVASSPDLGGRAVWTESHLLCVRLLPAVPLSA